MQYEGKSKVIGWALVVGLLPWLACAVEGVGSAPDPGGPDASLENGPDASLDEDEDPAEEEMPEDEDEEGPLCSDTSMVPVSSTSYWTATSVELQAGDRVNIEATGLVDDGGGATYTPEGTPQDGTHPGDPHLDLNHAALLARIGPQGPVTAVGASATFEAGTDGLLYLGINDDPIADNSGQYSATIDRTGGADVPECYETSLEPVPGAERWTTTSVDLQAGDRVSIEATGQIDDGGGSVYTPEGTPQDGTHPGDPYQAMNHAMLLARVGTEGAVIAVGASGTFEAPASGVLLLGINDDPIADNAGSYSANVLVRGD